MKLSIVILFAMVSVCYAQRPTYAGSRPVGYPDLASRFKEPNQPNQPESAPETDLNSRLGEDQGQGNPPNTPVDARGDQELVNRLNQWPREHRPFWLLNAEAIEAARKPLTNVDNQQQQQQPLGNRNGFQGTLGDRDNFQTDFEVRDNVQQQGNFQNRNGFQGNLAETITIKPAHQRPTFLSSNN